MAIVFDPPAGLLAQCPSLQVIHSMVRCTLGTLRFCGGREVGCHGVLLADSCAELEAAAGIKLIVQGPAWRTHCEFVLCLPCHVNEHPSTAIGDTHT